MPDITICSLGPVLCLCTCDAFAIAKFLVTNLRWPISANLPTQKPAHNNSLCCDSAASGSTTNCWLCCGLLYRKIGTYGPPYELTRILKRNPLSCEFFDENYRSKVWRVCWTVGCRSAMRLQATTTVYRDSGRRRVATRQVRGVPEPVAYWSVSANDLARLPSWSVTTLMSSRCVVRAESSSTSSSRP